MTNFISPTYNGQRTVDDFTSDITRRYARIESTSVRDVAKKVMASDLPVDQVWQALFYLTDEDYTNERNAIMFFATKATF